MQDEYYPTTGLPVSVVTPASESWDYTSVASQQKLVTISAPTPTPTPTPTPKPFAPTATPKPNPYFQP